MNVSVVGAGRVGTAIAVLLGRAGHTVAAVSGRAASLDRAVRFLPDVPFLEPEDAARAGDLVVLAVPDDAIEPMAMRLANAGAFRSGQWVAHVSGSLGLDALAAARDGGAGRVAIHPLQTFPDVAGAIDRIPGSAMALTADDAEGYALGERIAADLRADPFRLEDAKRPLYHAAAVFASNDLIVTSAIAEELFRSAGVPEPRRAMLPLQRASLDNVERLGPAAALTGPAVRGDASTIERNLEALREAAPDTVPAYIELCRVALDIGVRARDLPDERRVAVEDVLSRWS